MKISHIKAREIIDSRGMPTVEATVYLSNGFKGTASVPSGASTGKFEAVELRDMDNKRYFGKGTLNAVNNINCIINKHLTKLKSNSQRMVDKLLISIDSTPNKKKLGANATLAVSLANAKANANSLSIPLYRYLGGIYGCKLPFPMMNIINGGAHATNNIDIQEFMIVPVGFSNFKKAMQAGCEIYNSLKSILKKRNLSTSVGDEGGFAPDLSCDEEAIELILEAIKEAKYDTGAVKIALDVASSEWYKDGIYTLPKSKKQYSSEELISKWSDFVAKYPIISIEDPLSETDYTGWSKITELLGKRVMLVGDDLFVTNESRLNRGICEKMGNSILIKPNQIGTLSEALNVILLAKQHGYTTIISHRSGETDDVSIADIAVATNAGFIKTGAPCRMDRVCKYNRLLKIEEEIYRG